LGCIGTGTGNTVLATLGYAGALLHTLNHALFKSLLFYTAGNVYQAAHTLEIEKLGGLIKKMPQTAVLFLIAAIAICGLPPFNGFISEFILYTGLYTWLSDGTLFSLLAAIFSIVGLVAIGGLAIICFTKAFGIIFLGAERHPLPSTCREVSFLQLLPTYILAFVIVLIGILPQLFIHTLSQPVTLFTGTGMSLSDPLQSGLFELLQPISAAIWAFILLVIAIVILRLKLVRNRSISISQTWGCGYSAPTCRQQYTAGSFVRTYSKLFAPALLVEKEEEVVRGVFPAEAKYRTHAYDKVEKGLIDSVLRWYKRFMGRFIFLNNGKLQFYILYGILFILTVLSIPVLYRNIESFIDLLKTL